MKFNIYIHLNSEMCIKTKSKNTLNSCTSAILEQRLVLSLLIELKMVYYLQAEPTNKGYGCSYVTCKAIMNSVEICDKLESCIKRTFEKFTVHKSASEILLSKHANMVLDMVF